MTKKVTIVGKGTVGCMSVAHYFYHTDWDIEWIYDPNIPTTSVGEGTTLPVPRSLSKSLGWTTGELLNIGGTVKQGILKKDWAGSDNFFHAFPIDQMGVHFSAVDLQAKIFKDLKDNKRITLVEDNVNDPNTLDTNHVLMCVGTPKDFDEHNEKDSITLNSCYVTQCYWDHPRFQYTLTIARPYGWVFGIPLQNRCSVGYLFNKNITNLEDVKEDVKNIFKEYNLTPSDTTNYLEFSSYSRKNNFSEKVVYNGNASFFLEPLEATSTGMADVVNRLSHDIWTNTLPVSDCEEIYNRQMNGIEAMICMHYMAGSQWENEFWNNAKEKASSRFLELLTLNDDLAHILRATLYSNSVGGDYKHPVTNVPEYGQWGLYSWRFNIENLGLTEKIKSMLEENR